MQLELFEIEPKWLDRINSMLDAINENRKGKEVYLPAYQSELPDGNMIFAAMNHESIVWNVVTKEGETTEGMCANWRILSEVEKELNHAKV